MSASPYEDAQSWYYERYESEHGRAQRRGLLLLASLGLNGLLGAALLALVPLRRAEIVVLEKDRETGAVQIAPQLADVHVSRDEALSHWNLVRYLVARETYDPADLQSNYDLVYACSGAQVWSSYAPQYDRTAAGNLIDRYQRHTQVGFVLRSISFPEPGRALVRFATVTQTQGSETQTQNWISTVDFRYGQPPATPERRTLNPMGFEVTHYRRDPEGFHAELR